jgi:hypothetical protein
MFVSTKRNAILLQLVHCFKVCMLPSCDQSCYCHVLCIHMPPSNFGCSIFGCDVTLLGTMLLTFRKITLMHCAQDIVVVLIYQTVRCIMPINCGLNMPCHRRYTLRYKIITVKKISVRFMLRLPLPRRKGSRHQLHRLLDVLSYSSV